MNLEHLSIVIYLLKCWKIKPLKSISVFISSYIVMLATTYFSDETTEDKLNSYFGELIENQEIRDPLIQKIKELKVLSRLI